MPIPERFVEASRDRLESDMVKIMDDFEASLNRRAN